MKNLEINKTSLDGVWMIRPPTVFKDDRGFYIETFNRKLYEEAGIQASFVEDDISISKKNVLRGIHGNNQTAKLVSCLFGRFFLVVVNWNPKSPQFAQWETFELSDENRIQLFIPPGFGNGHVVLSDIAIFHYKQSNYYDPESQFTVLWNDPRLGIPWPCKDPILSQRDGALHAV